MSDKTFKQEMHTILRNFERDSHYCRANAFSEDGLIQNMGIIQADTYKAILLLITIYLPMHKTVKHAHLEEEWVGYNDALRDVAKELGLPDIGEK